MNQYDHLKNKLHNYKVDINKDKLWKNTSHAIPKRKRRPVALIMLFAGLVLSGWLLQPELRSSLHLAQEKNSDQLPQNRQANFTGHQDEVAESHGNTVEVLSSKLSGSLAKLFSSTSASAPDHESKTKIEGEKIFIENAKEQNEINQRVAMTTSDLQYKNSLPLVNKTGLGKIEGQNIQGFKNVNPDQKEISLSLLDQTENDLNIPIPEVDGPVDFLFTAVSQIPITINTVTTPASQANIQPLKGKFLQSVQIIQGIGFTSMKIYSLKPESAQYVAELKEKMSSLEILATSVNASFRLPAGFSLETGLQWTRLSTLIDHDWDTNERIQLEGVTTIIIDENGIPESITGNTDATRISHHRAKRFSAHQDMDIILALHKEIWNAKRLSVNAFVKCAYNLSYQAKGSILTAGGELIGFSKDENPFKRNSLCTMGGGLQINYHLSPHWNLTGSLTFDQTGYQYKDPAIPIRFQHSAFSSGLGIGYKF